MSPFLKMIYLVIFAYLLVLGFLYDVCGYRKHKTFHFVLALIVLILVSGLRYRLGSDTAVYMSYYKTYCHDIFHLKLSDFNDLTYGFEPFWVLFNSICKTLSEDFYLVQLIVSTIHIGVWGYFTKKVCPSLCFLMLVFFFLFEWLRMDSEIMREAVAMAFFLLAVLSWNNKKYFRIAIYVFIAFLFHKFSLIVFVLLFCYYLLLSKYNIAGILAVFLLIGIGFVYENWIYDVIAKIAGIDSSYIERIVYYGDSEEFGTAHWSWKGILVIFLSITFFLFVLNVTRGIYYEYSNLSPRIFESIIIVGCMVLSIKVSFPIAFRFYDYCQTFTSLLSILYLMKLKNYKSILRWNMLVFLVFMFFPIRHFYSNYLKSTFAHNPRVKKSIQYYPYNSIFNEEKDHERERGIFNYKRLR